MRAGQKVTPELKELFSKVKIEAWKKKIDWSFAEEFWDIELVISSRNRFKDFITFRQFKELVDSGENIPTLIKKGISKHLLFFMSKLIQGEFKNITKDDFLKLYREGKSLDDISKHYGIMRGYATFLRCLFDIKTKGAKYINRKNTEINLTQRQIEIVCGSLMGDAKKAGLSSVGFNHGGEQKDYLLWKYEQMRSICSENSLKGSKTIDSRNGKGGERWSFYTKANTGLEQIISEFYPDGKKNPTDIVLNILSPLSLAVWYQDDGSTDFCFREISKKENNTSPAFVFCTDSFNIDTCNRIILMLEKNFGIKSSLIPSHNKKGHRVKIGRESNQTFIDTISPHMLPMFNYKFDYVQYVKERTNDDPVQVSLAEVIRVPKGEEFEALSMDKKDEWVDKLFQYKRLKGFESIVKYNREEAKKDFSSVINFNTTKITEDSSIRACSIGYNLPIGFCSHFWSVRPKGGKSPREIFNNDSYLKEIIRKILQDGSFPKNKKVIKHLKLYRGNKSAGSFMPCVAKAIYQKYAGIDANVLDFCAGYGGRFAGAMAADNVSSYTCCDVSVPSIIGIRKMHNAISDKQAIIEFSDAIDFMKQMKDNQFCFCFTSPPYFDTEEYDESSQQSSRKFCTYSQWFQEWLLPCIKEACRVSRLVLINISNTGAYKIADDLRQEMQKNRLLRFEHTIDYMSFGGRERKEPLFGLSSDNSQNIM